MNITTVSAQPDPSVALNAAERSEPRRRVGAGFFRGVALALILAAVWLAASPLMAENFLWQVTTPKGGRAYILGSIHLAHKGLYPLRDPIMRAFAGSSALAVEIDMDALPPEAVGDFITTHGLSRDQRPLPERLTGETRALLEKSGYYNSSAMARMTPWLAALTIQVDELTARGFESQYGLDEYFINQARARKMPVVSLETMADQMGMLTEMSESESDLFLKSTLLELESLPQTINAFLDTWNRGDVVGFARVFFEEYDKYPELIPLLDKIIFRRNDKMAAGISRLLGGKRVYFIVVGAGHLVGDRSILTRLAAMGCTITQL